MHLGHISYTLLTYLPNYWSGAGNHKLEGRFTICFRDWTWGKNPFIPLTWFIPTVSTLGCHGTGGTGQNPQITMYFKQRTIYYPVREATPPLSPGLARPLGFEEQLSSRWDLFCSPNNFLGQGFCRSKELDELLIASNVIKNCNTSFCL